jgi:DNA-binding CsgD family transcriptional regulator
VVGGRVDKGSSDSVTWEQIRVAALAVCTERQIAVLRLWIAGMGTTRISLALDISESTAREHLRRAQQKIKLEIERERASV